MKVVQISGLRGILTVAFIATCLAAGFIAFPSIVAMNLWNFAAKYVTLPTIGIIQGGLLWTIVAIIGFIINDRNKYLVAFNHKSSLSDEELKKVIQDIKLQSQSQSKILKSMPIKPKDLTKEENSKNEAKDKV